METQPDYYNMVPKEYTGEIHHILSMCIGCDHQYFIRVPVEDFNKYLRGEYVQNAFPYLSPDDREMIISGTHPKCFEELFGTEE
jgi:hypothetical protein